MLDTTIPAVLTAPVDEPIYHPLHVVISADVHAKCDEYNDFFSTVKGNYFHGVLFSDRSSFKNIFVVVHLKKHAIESNRTSSNTFHLYVTTKFLEHYDFSYGCVVFFKPIHCYPLSKVVFCAKSVESYEWAKSEGWQSNFLLATCENEVLCRRNDVLLASLQVFGLQNTDMLFDLIAAVCEPVDQGILTISTTVVIINISDNLTYSQLKHELEHFGYRNDHISSYSQFSNDIATPCVKSNDEKIVLKLKVMQRHSCIIREMLTKIDVVSDPLNIVIVSENVFQMLKINLGQLVMVTASSLFSVGLKTNNALQKKSRLVAFYPSKCEMGYDAYVSPYLWFNLSSQPTSLKKSEDMHLEILHDRNVLSLPPYASEVYVTLVQSPLYDGTIDCDRILKNHFAQTRYVVKGDVFGIFFQDYDQKGYDLDYLRLPMVYFKISSIEGPASPLGYLIDIDHCKLYQIGTIQSYIPVLMEDSSFLFSELTYFDSPCPSGIDVYVDQLSSLVLPILKMWNRGNFQEFRVSTNILLTGENGCGKTVIVKALCKCLSLHLYHVNCHELAGESSAITETRLKAVVQKASFFAPCVMLLRNIEFIGKEKELKGENSRVLSSLNEQLKNVNPWGSEWPVIVIASTNNIKLLSGDLASSFLHHVHVDSPLERERKYMLRHLLRPFSLHPNISIDYMSQRTAGFLLGDLSAMVSEAVKFRYARLKKTYGLGKMHFLEEDVILSGIHLTHQDLLSALEKAQLSKAERSGAPKIPSVCWDDVGGLAEAKKEILDTIQLPLNHPELLSTGLRRSGVLLYGPPGTGKTLLAKAVATECSLNFLSVKGPELINMYVGQSEENVRAIFNQARGALPCVIFFDELDSLAPNRGRSGDSGGVTDRVVSQLLAELDGFKNSTEVFVIGATNRPDLLDPALLRPGRFDRHVYVGIPQDQESRLSILKALTKKLPLSENVDLVEIVEACPKNLSGADFYSLCSDAMMIRIEKNVELIEKGGMKIQDIKTAVETEDFFAALETLVPSVSESELREYQLTDQEL